jgi:hypothetical protein
MAAYNQFNLKVLMAMPILTGLALYIVCEFCTSWTTAHGHDQTASVGFVVLDEETGCPLPGAVVCLAESHTVYRSSATARDGRTRVVLHGTCRDSGSCFRRTHKFVISDWYVWVIGSGLSSPRYRLGSFINKLESSHGRVISLKVRRFAEKKAPEKETRTQLH